MSIVQDIRTAFSRRDNALMQLILLNVLVFAAVVLLEAITYLSQAQTVQLLVMRQLELSANLGVLLRHPWTVLTYAFTHQGFFHILFNMLNLYWFGQLLREYLGDRRLVSIYVLGALAGAAIFLFSYNLIPAFQPAVGSPMIGASAAVTATATPCRFSTSLGKRNSSGTAAPAHSASKSSCPSRTTARWTTHPRTSVKN